MKLFITSFQKLSYYQYINTCFYSMDSVSQSTNAEEAEVRPGLTVGCPVVGTFLSSCAGYVMVSLIVHTVAIRKRKTLAKSKELAQSRSVRGRSRGKASSEIIFIKCS